MLTVAQTHMADLVTTGTLTQTEADKHLAYVQDHLAEMPMFSSTDYPMMGTIQSMRHMNGTNGIMGHGHGMMGNSMGGNS